MVKVGKWIAKHRILMLIIGVLLIIPSVIGIAKTKVNYDLLSYLPDHLETVKGQDILVDEFGMGAFSMVAVENMDMKDVQKLEKEFEKVPHVQDVLWYDDVTDISLPTEMIPKDIRKAFINGDATMMLVLFDDTTSSDNSMEALTQLRKIANKQCFISGMTGIVTDIKNIAMKELPIYVVIAALLSLVVLEITSGSFVVPFLFLLSIGLAILYNLGSNIIFGETSYITQALTAVLQLGVTMDYSIFLWHSYKEQKTLCSDRDEAMAAAIGQTFSSIVGSSLTTVAGFVAICFMSFTLGRDLGIVMSKGVILGVLGTVTLLPCVIRMMDNLITKTSHKPLLPSVASISRFIVKHYKALCALAVVLCIPAFYGYSNVNVYYDMSSCLPEDLLSVKANEKLSESFDVSTNHLVLIDADVSQKNVIAMTREFKQVDGVQDVLSLDSLLGSNIPESILPDAGISLLKSDRYQMMLISSSYVISSDAVNQQIDELNAILKKYDEGGMLIGEAPCTKDLINCTDRDFKVVSVISIAAIFVIIALVLKSFSLPILLVAMIELAIALNLCIPYFTGTTLPFVGPILISTIQLGATVDYAILMTTRYKQGRMAGKEKKVAVGEAVAASAQSILVSGVSFFASTFGVGLYSNVDIISSMCSLIARGALCSVAVVLFLLPAMLLLCDGFIVRTTVGMKKKA